MERTSSAIKVWFWPRNGGGAPSEITSGSGSINPDNWGVFGAPLMGCGKQLTAVNTGTPMANYNSNNCNIASKFKAANVIINLTLCGDWAGQASIWAQSACANTGTWFVPPPQHLTFRR